MLLTSQLVTMLFEKRHLCFLLSIHIEQLEEGSNQTRNDDFLTFDYIKNIMNQTTTSTAR